MLFVVVLSEALRGRGNCDGDGDGRMMSMMLRIKRHAYIACLFPFSRKPVAVAFPPALQHMSRPPVGGHHHEHVNPQQWLYWTHSVRINAGCGRSISKEGVGAVQKSSADNSGDSK